MKTIVIIFFAVAALILSGCVSEEQSPPPTVGQEVILSEPAQLLDTRRVSYSSTSVAQGANAFAFELAAALVRDIGDDNMVVSPYSVWLPLAALVNATSEPYQSELINVLAGMGLTPEDINHAASRMLFDLTRSWGSQYPLRIANAIFINDIFSIRNDFAQTFIDYFRGEILPAPFPEPEAVDSINHWVYTHTEGLIPSMIRNIEPEAIAIIVNALYFSDNWTIPFFEGATKRDTFFGPTGDTEVYFMRFAERHAPYFEDNHLQGIDLHFESGGGMIILLPKEVTATELLASMTHEYFEYITQNFDFIEGSLALPRFKIEHSIDNLTDVLVDMGIPLFDGAAAPLTNGLIYDDIPVWINSAIQRAVIEVDEEGVTAAAATLMDMVGAAPPQERETFEMICDRPFVFILYRNTVDGGRQVLFTGIVNQP
ncbi:MAG: hypothetical protein FWC73_08530 [Defluviitaleaceae bacterium]|nr:hypothetical protein [Defluviitaleaceae bacterium]